VLELNYRKPEVAQNSKLAFEMETTVVVTWCQTVVSFQVLGCSCWLGAYMLFILFS